MFGPFLCNHRLIITQYKRWKPIIGCLIKIKRFPFVWFFSVSFNLEILISCQCCLGFSLFCFSIFLSHFECLLWMFFVQDFFSSTLIFCFLVECFPPSEIFYFPWRIWFSCHIYAFFEIKNCSFCFNISLIDGISL